MINSKNKGKVGEREFANLLKKHGFNARRGQQFKGTEDSPDIICECLPFHFEVKRVQKLNLDNAMDQARKDCGKSIPVVAHRKNNHKWLITIDAEYFIENLCKQIF